MEDPRPLMTESTTIMKVLHSAEDYAMYPHVVISSPFGD
jgi:hypothetical protein